jgi:uncharacterized protein YciI
VYLLLVHYTQPMPAVDALTAAHRSYLDTYLASGHLMMSGRRNPPSGGVILAKFPGRDAVNAFIAADPFVTGSVARYEVIEFNPGKLAPEVKAFVDKPL